jgi:hypothetical protein
MFICPVQICEDFGHYAPANIKLAMKKAWLFQVYPCYLQCLPLRLVNNNNKTEFNQKLNSFKLKR